MVDSLIQWLNVPNELIIIIISALPIIELRGAIPVGINLFGMPWYFVILLAIIGNLLPVPLLLLFFQTLVKYIRRIPLGAKLVNPIVRHAEKHSASVEKYQRIGLIIFVGIPLPWTGAWTASIISSLLGISFARAFFAIAAGVVISGIIVTVLCLMGWVGAVIAGVGLLALAVFSIWKR
ncbi:MAG: small multi-drug export protein [Dehalococcoidales bacterium]|nr:small multi-drug export protein [Dehalococcoidales bacterium]